MSTLNDLEMAYLRGLGKTGSINSMRSAQYGAISDKAIQDTYVALSTLTPVEDFSVNDHMRCGLGGFTDDEISVLVHENLMARAMAVTFSEVPDSDNLANYGINDLSIVPGAGRYGRDALLFEGNDSSIAYAELPVWNIPLADPEIDLAPRVVGGEEYTAYMAFKAANFNVSTNEQVYFQVECFKSDGSTSTAGDLDSDDAHATFVGDSGIMWTRDPNTYDALNPTNNDFASPINGSYRELTLTFTVPTDAAFVVLIFGTSSNGEHDGLMDFYVDSVGIWEGTSTVWRD